MDDLTILVGALAGLCLVLGMAGMIAERFTNIGD